MADSTTFLDMLERDITRARENKHPVIIFGASKAGWQVSKVLEQNGIQIAAFCDNGTDKTGRTFYGYPTHTPADISRLFPDALVFIGIFRKKNFQSVSEQLGRLGLAAQNSSILPYIYSYYISVAKRPCNRDLFAVTIEKLSRHYETNEYRYGQLDSDLFVSPAIVGVITQKCNLRCLDCGQRIPYYKQPAEFPIDRIVKDIENYCSAFDLVPEVCLHGGEPFLHPDIGKICLELSRIPNLVSINITTNGKILPSHETLQELAASGVDIHQSDYGRLSKNQDAILEECKNNKIYCDIAFVQDNQLWTRLPAMKDYERSPEANDALFNRCVWEGKLCSQIMDGNLYRCPASTHASAQGLFIETDFVQLSNPAVSDDQRRNSIREFISRTTALNACRYCNPGGGIQVQPAIQLSKRLRRLLDKGNSIDHLVAPPKPAPTE